MANEPLKTMGGGCLGALIGAFLGVVIGGFIVSVAQESTHGVRGAPGQSYTVFSELS
jgi:hypothetical protein